MKIILFGAGRKTEQFLEEGKHSCYEIIAIADNDKTKYGAEFNYRGKFLKVISTNDITNYDYDNILITISNKVYQLDITEQLINLGVEFEKIKLLQGEEFKNAWRISNKLDTHDEEILFDVTKITALDCKTGIQRVVREIYRNVVKLEKIGVLPVQNVGGKWITAKRFDCRIQNTDFDNIEYRVDIKSKKVCLPDATWDIECLYDSLKGSDDVCTFVYDLIPITHPVCFFDKHHKHFAKWIDEVVRMSGKCICISRAVSDTLIAYYKEKNVRREKPLEVHYIHLGFDIPDLQGEVRREIVDFVQQGTTFLTVGTVEIRKNHYILLQGFKEAIQQLLEGNYQLLILGRDGWMNEEFKKMYETDEEIRGKVLWIKDASDSEVQWAYRHCAALVFPSKIEGFGLPLVEAAHFKLPILCSDIPIFREVIGDYADYFKVDDVESLRDALVNWLTTDKHPDSGRVRIYSWKECAEEVLEILEDRAKPYAILQ